MPGFTKQAIKRSFMKLLNERPVSRITVKDIVEDCGINRNSFYYHYQDLPSMVEEIIIEETNEIIRRHPTVDSLEEGLDVAVSFALKNKRAALHLYHSSTGICLSSICGGSVSMWWIPISAQHLRTPP